MQDTTRRRFEDSGRKTETERGKGKERSRRGGEMSENGRQRA
jgi:hypothetical protein